jgi:hypothetical protein
MGPEEGAADPFGSFSPDLDLVQSGRHQAGFIGPLESGYLLKTKSFNVPTRWPRLFLG